VLQGWVILAVSVLYLSILFAIAYYGDKRAKQKRSLIANPYIYTLSIAVYCTSWTFYGSVGRAASSGMGFLPIYLGPTLMFLLGWFVLRKIIRISKANRIASIADFIASRYGKSTLLGGLVSVIAVIGIMPYISLQLKAISTSFNVLLQYPDLIMPSDLTNLPFFQDTALYVALAMAAFSILFGVRHIDASEHHEGLVAAIAFESVVKLVAFLAVGIFVTFQLYDGFADIFAQAAARPEMARLFTLDSAGGYGSWFSLTALSMVAIICLPRQFQVSVVENVDESHLKKAIWLFPLYLFAINILFVLPIAFGGLLQFPAGQVDADTFVLTIPMAQRHELLALFAFIGGLSAATGMMIVATVAISTMVCNNLVMPVLLRVAWLHLADKGDLTGLLLSIRRGSILFVLLLGYLYMRLIGESYALVSIGLVSFAAAAQFAPAILIGIFWKGANRAGALVGLSAGFLVWAYTLLLPSFARSGWLAQGFLNDGPWGLSLLKPYALFGLSGLDHISHALFWSLAVNISLFIGISLFTRQTIVERGQGVLFVDVFKRTRAGSQVWRGTASIRDLRELVARFLGPKRSQAVFAAYARHRGLAPGDDGPGDVEWVRFAERQLAGAIGTASARVMVATVVDEGTPDIDQVMEILDEASQVIEYSRRLEEKSHQLESATEELQAANARLQELDKLKDDFVSTVSHELRTPLTSIRSFSEILHDNPRAEESQKKKFLGIIIAESERLTRLINDILDLAKMEAGKLDWYMADIDTGGVIEQAVAATSTLFSGDEAVELHVDLPKRLPAVRADRDRLTQVIVNLLSNAAKFCDRERGRVTVTTAVEPQHLRVSVTDNGAGIRLEYQSLIFEKFQQASDTLTDKPQGTGLGLPICREIVDYFGGRIWVESRPGKGSTFSFTVPFADSLAAPAQVAE
jgi:Na+/proline symporter/nitrogen-specific signal transduction histidine kinase